MSSEQLKAHESLTDDQELALRRERDDLYDRLLRSAAEFDNYRKRTDRERREMSDAVSADLVRDLLPVVEDLERALAASAGSADQSLRAGLELIHRQLLDGLEVFPVLAQATHAGANSIYSLRTRFSGARPRIARISLISVALYSASRVDHVRLLSSR